MSFSSSCRLRRGRSVHRPRWRSQAPKSGDVLGRACDVSTDRPCSRICTVDARDLGKYRVIAQLGSGGMAEVFLSMVSGPVGTGFTKLAVVKTLRESLAEDPEFMAMLVDEARISARLNHPNVVQTLEVGVERDQFFLALEFLDGQPLHRIQTRAARAGTPMARELSYVIVADALAGLHYAHELADYDGAPLSIVHRDVTPQNLFVTYEGIVKVVDFGIAKAAGRAAETKHGIVKGKLRYMSPEQALGHPVDRRSDIFSAGILLWEAATGARFWNTMDETSIIQALIGGEFDPSPRSVDPSVPDAIDTICRKAIAADVGSRYETAAAFQLDLEGVLADDIVAARRKLGPFVASFFEKDRAVVRDVIARASKATAERSSVTLQASSESMEEFGLRVPSAAPPARSSMSPLVVSPPLPAAPTSQPPAISASETNDHPGDRRRVVVGVAAAIALTAIGLAGWQALKKGHTAAAEAAATRAPTAVEDARTDLDSTSASAKVDVTAAPSASSATLEPSRAGRAARPTVRFVAPARSQAAPATASTDPREGKPKAPVKPTIDQGDPWPGKAP
jgi:serine/threonine protein kinase